VNDFGINITGYHGVVKPRSFSLPKNATVAERTFVIASGPGTSPEPGRRTVRGTWLSDGAQDTISSYDFEYLKAPNGDIVKRLPEPVDDTVPVKLAGEEPQAKVRRKRG
jgi:hypothetical protein